MEAHKMNIYTQIFGELVTKWWQVQVGVFATWASWLFGDSVFMFLDPNLAKAWVPIAFTGLVGLCTFVVAVLKGRKEIKGMDREARQDEMSHYWDNVKRLKELGYVKDDTPLEEINKMLSKLGIPVPDIKQINK